ncbi:uncharacterized protein [Nothobranchius furzeri]|uniref:uncharacterized protein n=1 Tax=Nothobranchius furzeri TaxID=105023 RepID=UPI0039047271
MRGERRRGLKLHQSKLSASCVVIPSGPLHVGLLLQRDGSLNLWCPPAGMGVATMTGTGHLATTASNSRLNNRRVEQGPLGVNVPHCFRDTVKALPEEGVEDRLDRFFCQAFPADPHYAFP